ncbi:hypothetical protein TOPH_05165 [Tolypocladium ophioglossoides CBS 100239]|uniref:CENP-V/GFA domain-containing protein n=1 Tax=Tolypocladium ophioglossoides (strain CBS 100239) TaxID=1163406 RepID=A0A0L0N8D3_TOLOC|nr:hypothetical protein TOPH_05165 [Tolypocladium ophioglossoides CBS 100239]
MAYATKKDLFPMLGGCSCGHVRYRLALPPLLVHCCHCASCQRHVGGAFAINAIVESAAITLLPSAFEPLVPGCKTNPEPLPAGLHPAFARLTDGVPTTPAETEGTGKPVLVTVPSGSGIGQTMASCPVCRTGLWNNYADAGPLVTYLRATTLDRAWEVDPDVHIFTHSKRDFVSIADGKPQFEYYYDNRAAFYRPDVFERVAALKPKEEAYKVQLRAALS